MSRQADPEQLELLGGRLCLEFVNSACWSDHDVPVSPRHDSLRHPGDFARWARRLDLADTLTLDDEEFAALLRLRLAAYLVFTMLDRGQPPPVDSLSLLRDQYAEATGAGTFRLLDRAWRLDWTESEPRFTLVTDIVALLGDAQLLPRVRRCPGPDCGWLFLDTSGRRRWCSMRTCGSRVKMRRLAARRRMSGTYQ